MPFYFAYGSNMDEVAMRSRCPQAKALGRARLAAHRFVIMGNGWASVRPDPAATVHGVMFDLTLSDIPPLDRYEDVGGGLYTKALHPVLREGRAPCQALVYLGTDPTDGGRSPDGYVAAIVAAAHVAALPPPHIAMLESLMSGRASYASPRRSRS